MLIEVGFFRSDIKRKGNKHLLKW